MTSESETLEQLEAAQQQIEDFARMACRVRDAVNELENMFCRLADSPMSIDEAMPRLSANAEVIADVAYNWATLSNTDFDA
jgi:hypothetical protein